MDELSKLGESLIDEAIASGELKPPPAETRLDLEEYFAAPSDWRAVFGMLKGNGFVPPEIELMKRADELEEELSSCGDPAERMRLRSEIDGLRIRFRMAVERLRAK